MKVLGLPKIAWSILFLIIQILNFGFLVGAMNYGYWFKQVWKFDGHSVAFKGGLLGPYNSILDGICGDSDTYKDCWDNCDDNCYLFKIWYGASVVYAFFDIIACILVVVMAFILVLDMCKVRCCKGCFNVFTTAIIMAIVTALHFTALSSWAGIVKLQTDDCTHDLPYSGVKSVCIEGGAAFAIWNVIYLNLVTFGYIRIALIISRKEAEEN